MKYRKRETVDAVQWFKPGDYDAVTHAWRGAGCFIIWLNQNWHDIYTGYWIITHADGTHSVCKAADFDREYEVAP